MKRLSERIRKIEKKIDRGSIDATVLVFCDEQGTHKGYQWNGKTYKTEEALRKDLPDNDDGFILYPTLEEELFEIPALVPPGHLILKAISERQKITDHGYS